MDSSPTLEACAKYDSSAGGSVLLFPGLRGRVEALSLVGLSSAAGVSFMAASKAEGRSIAPGGLRFLDGLPWGVWVGVMKLARVVAVGVVGRSGYVSLWEVRVWRGGGGAGRSSDDEAGFPAWELAKRFAMKLDIAGWRCEVGGGCCGGMGDGEVGVGWDIARSGESCALLASSCK